MAAKIEDIGACVFDAYGTLFDVAAAAVQCRDALGDKADELSVLWRTRQLEYTWLRSLMQEYVEFLQVTGDGLDYAMAALGIEDDASVPTAPAAPPMTMFCGVRRFSAML